MPTLDAMVEETIGHLRAFSVEQEMKTTLDGSLTDSATTFQVDNIDRVTGGLVEIDEELVEVSEADSLTNTVTVYPWGRGQQGSTAAAHSDNARVTISPRWPRVRVKRVLNEVIAGLWPDLFKVATDQSNTTSFLVSAYPLPATARRVLDVQWETTGTPTEWVGVGSWRLDQAADATDFPTGTALSIGDPMDQGRTLKVVYAAEPVAMTSGSQEFSTQTGLPDSASDLVCIGAAARLVVTAELARSQVFTIEHTTRLSEQPVGAATSASKYLQALYQARLEAERDRLYGRYPIKLRRTWL